jgi:predicted phosphodiesterase
MHVRERDRFVIPARLRIWSPVPSVQCANPFPQPGRRGAGTELVHVPCPDTEVGAVCPSLTRNVLRQEFCRELIQEHRCHQRGTRFRGSLRELARAAMDYRTLNSAARYPSAMRFQLVSDVHVEFHADGGLDFVRSLDPEGVDVLVLAGDIAVGAGIVPALGAFCDRYRRATVVYVHGNHEFYGTDRASVLRWTLDATRTNPNLVWLDAGAIELGDRRVLGGPLWFRKDPRADQLKRGMADFSEIRGFESWVYDENARLLDLLKRELRHGDVVVTHHLPTVRSVAGRYNGHPLNAFFVCDVEDLIREREPAVWMHGHTHTSVDTHVGKTRILCNPFGYAQWELNRDFVDHLVVEV